MEMYLITFKIVGKNEIEKFNYFVVDEVIVGNPKIIAPWTLSYKVNWRMVNG